MPCTSSRSHRPAPGRSLWHTPASIPQGRSVTAECLLLGRAGPQSTPRAFSTDRAAAGLSWNRAAPTQSAAPARVHVGSASRVAPTCHHLHPATRRAPQPKHRPSLSRACQKLRSSIGREAACCACQERTHRACNPAQSHTEMQGSWRGRSGRNHNCSKETEPRATHSCLQVPDS